MSSSRGSYQPQACNLCWKELQAPFLVTSCNHVFCLSHRDHESFKQQSCPGCGHHLSESKGLKQANYDVKSSDLPVLNGVTPDAALKVAGTAIKFWVLQERTAAAIAQRLAWYTLGMRRVCFYGPLCSGGLVEWTGPPLQNGRGVGCSTKGPGDFESVLALPRRGFR